MKKEVLTKKTLLSWLILHRVSVGDTTQDISIKIPKYISLYTCSSTTRAKLSTLYKSLTYKEYLMPSYHHAQKPFTITLKGKEYLKMQCEEWLKTVQAHLLCINKGIEACQFTTYDRLKSSLTELDYPFVGQYLEYKNVVPFFILQELYNSDESMKTVPNIRSQLLKHYGWVCSMPTLTRIVGELVAKGLILVSNEQNESSKKFQLDKGQEALFSSYQDLALHELESGKKKLEEMISYFTRYQKREEDF